MIHGMSRASLSKNPREVATMFDGVAERYDLLNDIASLGQDRAWRGATLQALKIRPGERVLDLAAGTATSSELLMLAGADVVACDFSIGMLEVGARRQPMLDLVAGDATKLPFADGSFDAVTISFGLRNVVDAKMALAEMARVTRPGGRMVICEFSTPTWGPFKKIYQEYLVRAIPAFAKVSSNPEAYSYLAESITAWPDQTGLGRMILRSGWSKVEVRNMTGGIVALHRAFL